jgi:hypothetical protein
LKGEDFVVTAEQTIDPREVIYDFEKKILSVASKQGVNLPENNKKYLISRICKALIVQYPIKGEKEPLELEPLEIGEK